MQTMKFISPNLYSFTFFLVVKCQGEVDRSTRCETGDLLPVRLHLDLLSGRWYPAMQTTTSVELATIESCDYDDYYFRQEGKKNN